MAPETVSRDPTANLTHASAGFDRRDVGLAILCGALALWSYRWALGSYFSPDDLILLERARGLAATPDTWWRVLSGRLYFSLVVPVFGSNAVAYLTINWLLHAVNAGLLYAFARRAGGGMLAASIAAAMFASSRLFLSVVGQVVGIGDLLALAFVLMAAITLTTEVRFRPVIAALLFGFAVLSKESVILIPIALLFLPPIGRDLQFRLARIAPLLAVAVSWALYLAASGVSATMLGGPAYEARFGLQIVRSLGTYATWIANFTDPAPDFTRPASNARLFVGAAGLLAATILIGLVRRRIPLAHFGLAWFMFALLPVLPLVHQHNLHYLYGPFAGIAIAAGATFAATMRSLKAGRVAIAWGLAALLIVGHAGVSDSLMRERIRDELEDENVPYDPFVRKIELIRRMSRRVEVLAHESRGRLVVVVPRIDDRLAELFRGLLPGVVDQGRGLRALHPGLDSIAFVDRWTPAYRDFELVAGSVDGMIVGFGSGPDAHLRFAGVLVENEFVEEALQHLGDAIPAYPDDPRLALAERTLRARIASTAQPMPQSSSRPSSPPIR